MQQTVIHLSLRKAERRSNPSSWIAAPSFLGLAMTMEGDMTLSGSRGSITLTKPVDSSSSILAWFAAAGAAIKRAILRVVAPTDGKTDSKITIDMRDVFISGYQVSGNNTVGIPLETVSLNFSKVNYDEKGGK